jgi:type VI secretion system protein ImpB
MAESIHGALGRDRAPRVHISYDVEVGGATEVRELPFVMGVLGDFTGQPEEPLARLGERTFVEVTPDNFDAVLRGMRPHLKFSVPNRLGGEEGEIGVDLRFQSLDDFAPDRVAMQVSPLKKLLELRRELSDLRGSLQGNDRLEEVLQATLHDASALDRLKREMEPAGGDDGER